MEGYVEYQEEMTEAVAIPNPESSPGNAKSSKRETKTWHLLLHATFDAASCPL